MSFAGHVALALSLVVGCGERVRTQPDVLAGDSGTLPQDGAQVFDAASTDTDAAAQADANQPTDGAPTTDQSQPTDGAAAADLSQFADAAVDPDSNASPDTGTNPQVVVTNDLKDEGRDCFRIQTPSATYWYDKKGAGFSSLLDPQGNDWISWRSGGGSGGEYRGIPNLGHCCHPGYDTATSSLVTQHSGYAKIRSTGTGFDDTAFEITWEFWADHATLTIVTAPSNYYMLYEGTPGGAVDADDYFVTSAGSNTRAKLLQSGEPITSDLAAPEWIYFEDSGLSRALLLVHHQDDAIGERYWTMNSEMTVFGFGRTGHGASMGMSAAPQTLSIAFVEQISFAKASQLATTLAR